MKLINKLKTGFSIFKKFTTIPLAVIFSAMTLYSTPVLITEPYTVGGFEPGEGNLILDQSPAAGSYGYGHRHEGTGDDSKLTDGSVSDSYPELCVISDNAVIIYELASAGATVSEINIYQTWGDTGRDKISIDSIQYQTVSGGDTWFTIENSYINYEHESFHNKATLFDPDTGILADGATSIRFNYAHQENNWIGCAEIEVLGTQPDVPRATLSTKYTAPRKAAVTATILNCGEDADTVDFYFAFGPVSEGAPTPLSYTNGLSVSDAFDIEMTGLDLNTTYVCAYYIENNLGAFQSVKTITFTTLDGSEITWLGLVSEDWSDAMNWDTETAPSGEVKKIVLTTPENGYYPKNLDVSGLNIEDLAFNENCTDDFTVTGEHVTLNNMISTDNTRSTITIENEVTFSKKGVFVLTGNTNVRFAGLVHGIDDENEIAFHCMDHGGVYFLHPSNDFCGKLNFHVGRCGFTADGSLGRPPANEPESANLNALWGSFNVIPLEDRELNVVTMHPNRYLRDGIWIYENVELIYTGKLGNNIGFNGGGSLVKHAHLSGPLLPGVIKEEAEEADPFNDGNMIGSIGNLLLFVDSGNVVNQASRAIHSSDTCVDFNGYDCSVSIANYSCGIGVNTRTPNFHNSVRDVEVEFSGVIRLNGNIGLTHVILGGAGDIRHTGGFLDHLDGRDSIPFHKSGQGRLTLAGDTSCADERSDFRGDVTFDYRPNNTPRLQNGELQFGYGTLELIGNDSEQTESELSSLRMVGGLINFVTHSGKDGMTVELDKVHSINRDRFIDFRLDSGTSLVFTDEEFDNDDTFRGLGPHYIWNGGESWAMLNQDGTPGPISPSFFITSGWSDYTLWDIPCGITELPSGLFRPYGIRIADTGGPVTLVVTDGVAIRKQGAEQAGAILIAPDVGGDVTITGGSLRPQNYNGAITVFNYTTNHTVTISSQMPETNDNMFNLVGPGTTIIDNDENTFYYGPNIYGGGTVKFTSITNSGIASALGKGLNPAGTIYCEHNSIYEYIGTLADGHTSNRRFELYGDVTLKASGAGPLALVSSTPILSGHGFYSSRLILDGASAGVINGSINLGTLGSLVKRGSGTWIINTTDSSYEYPTEVETGTLVVNGSLPSSVKIHEAGTFVTTEGLAIKRHFANEGVMRISVNDMAEGEIPVKIYGKAELGGTLEFLGTISEDTVILEADNGISGNFDNVSSRYQIQLEDNKVIAKAISTTMFIVR